MRLYRLFLLGLYLVSFAILLRLALEGMPYYLTPLVERPRHELYWELKPGGGRGHLYGVVGTAMMLVMLFYSVRKRLRWLRRWGPLRLWLDLHIYLGVCGPLLVVLHTSFKVQGLVALAFWSMVVVAVSGVVGRYLYLGIPRTRAGDELSLEKVAPGERERVQKIRRYFHYWHVFHKPFAVVMYLFMTVHIVVAWMAGYAWGS